MRARRIAAPVLGCVVLATSVACSSVVSGEATAPASVARSADAATEITQQLGKRFCELQTFKYGQFDEYAQRVRLNVVGAAAKSLENSLDSLRQAISTTWSAGDGITCTPIEVTPTLPITSDTAKASVSVVAVEVKAGTRTSRIIDADLTVQREQGQWLIADVAVK